MGQADGYTSYPELMLHVALMNKDITLHKFTKAGNVYSCHLFHNIVMLLEVPGKRLSVFITKSGLAALLTTGVLYLMVSGKHLL